MSCDLTVNTSPGQRNQLNFFSLVQRKARFKDLQGVPINNRQHNITIQTNNKDEQ